MHVISMEMIRENRFTCKFIFVEHVKNFEGLK